MEIYLLVATRDGLVVCDRHEGVWRQIRHSLEGRKTTSVIARDGVILAGTTEGVFRSEDLGATWREASEGLDIRHVRWLAYHPTISDFELAGIEPAGIYVSRDGARSWRECTEVAEMRVRFGWSLPYSPEAGCVRGFAIHGRLAYAAVEDGCVLVSHDGGATWQVAEGSKGYPDHNPAPSYVHSDVHSIEVHPSSPDMVFAPTGGGFYRSMDGGKRWEKLYSRCYCRAIWVDPFDPDHLLLGPADGVDWNGRIEETLDGGKTWRLASEGLNVPWRSHMVERFIQGDDELLAVLSNGEMIASSLEEFAWKRVLPEVNGVRAAALMKI